MSDTNVPVPKPLPRPVLWTRGQGCHELAELVSQVEPVRVVGDVVEACLRHRAPLLVSRRLSPSFDLIDNAAPSGFDPEVVKAVVATVAGGPHSALAASVAKRLGDQLGVEAIVTCAFQEEGDKGRAVSAIETLHVLEPDIEYRIVQADDAQALVAQIPEGALIVLGAPGGGWLQRNYFGPGAKLLSEAPAGAVVVRHRPERVFQAMIDPVFVGPLREAVDILRIHDETVLAVVDRAQLIGIVRRAALSIADPGVPVETIMEAPVSVPMTASLDEAMVLAPGFSGAAIPVVDDDDRLVGALPVPGD
ncbi:MAG: CBS domain-containing protein [Acidimicrobiia bacterium]|nr:CBS domain-containing protein [Acidimicrobiia bacterium]MDH4307793.1 CBS domain-containing protein [Acidimicrobiia bacterium]MDH5293160.1 CBS domain-containing protein [Acidimicrobiia bacterium]